MPGSLVLHVLSPFVFNPQTNLGGFLDEVVAWEEHTEMPNYMSSYCQSRDSDPALAVFFLYLSTHCPAL